MKHCMVFIMVNSQMRKHVVDNKARFVKVQWGGRMNHEGISGLSVVPTKSVGYSDSSEVESGRSES